MIHQSVLEDHFAPPQQQASDIARLSSTNYCSSLESQFVSHAESDIRESDVPKIGVSVDQLSFDYGDSPALKNVSFDVANGSLFGLLGPNGSGKTTLFRLLATLIPMQHGQVTVLGKDLAQQPELIRQQLGITFQAPALDVRLTVQENLACHGAIYGLAKKEVVLRSGQLLEDLDLLDRQHERVERLSGGQKRRVELAKGLMHRPSLLLLDEPSTGLDPAARRQFWDLIQAHRHNMTIIVTTHLMDEAEHCDRLLLLDKGQVVAAGSPSELQASLPGERLSIRLQPTAPNTAAELKRKIEHLLRATGQQAGDRIVFRLHSATDALQSVMSDFRDHISTAEVARPTLEDVFLEKTGRDFAMAEALESEQGAGQ